jgi:hypothetical protein
VALLGPLVRVRRSAVGMRRRLTVTVDPAAGGRLRHHP